MVYFHWNCSDGRVAASLLVAHLLKQGAAPHVRSASASMHRFEYPPAGTDTVYFVDLCPQIDMVERLEAWARRIMINTVIDGFRQDRQRRATERGLPTDAEAVDGMGDAVINGFLQRMEAEAFAELLLRVPPMSRNVFNLFAVDGYAHAEIATLLGISEGTSKWHVANARGILKKALTALNAVPENPLVP